MKISVALAIPFSFLPAGLHAEKISLVGATVINPAEHAEWRADRMGKSTIFESARLLVGLNAFEPGQSHALHAHAGMDKVYHVLQGEGGKVMFPVPWAREPSISHLATPEAMQSLLTAAGFRVVDVHDSTEESQRWFETMTARMAQAAPAVTFQAFLGADFPEMARNQVVNLRDRRIRTVSYVCEA